jgi:cytochrome c oxidase assembly factor CtaG
MQNKLKYKFPAPIYARISWNIKKVNYFISSSIKSYGPMGSPRAGLNPARSDQIFAD